MIRGIYTAASAMTAQQIRQDVLTENLANTNTTGYKRDETITQGFYSMLLKQLQNGDKPVEGNPDLGLIGTGVAATEIATMQTQGTTTQTGNPLDLALEGDGFFVIQNPTTQEIRYTRDGHFSTNAQNQLVTEDGWNVMGNNGPISLTDWQNTITEDGSLVGTSDSLQIAIFPSSADLAKEGNNRYRALNNNATVLNFNGQARPTTRIHQATLESSNVNPIQEMVTMITAMRSYETAQRLIQSQDQTLEKAVNELGRI